jgi:broad specificity phosphatase PhoE
MAAEGYEKGMQQKSELWLIRHGETAWSVSGQHTSKTDIPLTDRGRERAKEIRRYLDGCQFALILTSPRQRARDTCRIAGYGEAAEVDQNLAEWDYGEYEGRTTAGIQEERPRWSIWEDGPLGGETLDEVRTRAQVVIDRAVAAGGPVALFSHAHMLRILAATWIGLGPKSGRLFALGTGSISRLGFEREERVILTWNRSFENDSMPVLKQS